MVPRSWELHHRLLASESVTHHTLFRQETRWPGYYYRGDHMEKAPVYHIID